MDKVKKEFYVNGIKYQDLTGEDKKLADKILDLLKDDISTMNLYDECFVNLKTNNPEKRLNVQSNYPNELVDKFLIVLGKVL